MGRITIFTSMDCPHCMRAKGALIKRNIPFREIDLLSYPFRRNDMLSLCDKLSVPQVFFNGTAVGGADDLIGLLEIWDDHESKSPLEFFNTTIAPEPDPVDSRLALPLALSRGASQSSGSLASLDSQNHVELPNGDMVSVLEAMMTLDRILHSRDRPYKTHWYKKCFINTDGVTDIKNHFGCKTREEAVEFGRQLQAKKILDHVCGDHLFRDDGYYFFRLQCYHQPHVLNSFRVWGEPARAAVANNLIFKLKNRLNKLLSKCTDNNGLIDYIKARHDPNYPKFEDATCQLQGIDMAELDENTRLAFGMNLYNLFITYAFIKVGVGTSSLARGAFFGQVKMNIGGDILSFNDLENGVLRANTRHPYASKVPFAKDDPRLRLSLSKLDPRVHFGLNCGAKSCPPVKYFRPESLEEELRVVSLSFCETEEAVKINEKKHEMHLSMLLKWFQSDFVDSRDELPEKILEYLKGQKKEMLTRMVEKAALEHKPITIKFQSYDWTANASRFEPYSKSTIKANERSPSAILRFQGHFDCSSSTPEVAAS